MKPTILLGIVLFLLLCTNTEAVSYIVEVNTTVHLVSGVYAYGKQFPFASANLTLYDPMNNTVLYRQPMLPIHTANGEHYFTYDYIPTVNGTYSGYVEYYNTTTQIAGSWDTFYAENIAQRTKKEIGIMEISIVIILLSIICFIIYIGNKYAMSVGKTQYFGLLLYALAGIFLSVLAFVGMLMTEGEKYYGIYSTIFYIIFPTIGALSFVLFIYSFYFIMKIGIVDLVNQKKGKNEN